MAFHKKPLPLYDLISSAQADYTDNLMKIYQKGLGDGGAERFVYQRLQHSFESENEIAMDSSDKKHWESWKELGKTYFLIIYNLSCKFFLTIKKLIINLCKIMMNDYSNLIRRIEDRYNPDQNSIVEQRMFTNLSDVDRDIAKYVKMAMSAVDEHYTAVTKEAGERVKKHLADGQQGMNITYRYQGSVMTNTHIRGASDIDLLTFTNKFESTEIQKVREILKEPYQSGYSYSDLAKLRNFNNSFTSYQGNYLQDLRDLRASNETIMRYWYDECDIHKAKAVHIFNKDLKRDVDIVTASWLDSVAYVLNSDERYRGVEIYNKKTDSTETPSYPFLAIDNINTRSSYTKGRLKQMIRF